MKKKIFGITLAVCLVVLSIASSTMAYFTDVDEKTHAFTSGNVDIKFTGDVFIDDNSSPTTHPGKQIGADASVANIGTEDAYIGIVINFSKKLGKTDAEALFENLGNGSWETKYVENANTCSIYVICPNVIVKNNETGAFFSKIQIPLEWNNDKMVAFNGTEIIVNAYATQAYGFDNAKTALTTAFSNEWSAVGN